MPSIRKAKKLGTYEKTKAYDKEMYEETKALSIKVNKRLRELKKAGYLKSWAGRKLEKRLKTKKIKAYSQGKVRVSKGLTNTQYTSIQKASRQFLESQTSTVKGIEATKKATIESLKKTFSKDMDFGSIDAEVAYEMLGNKDFEYFNQEDRIPASEMWALIDDAIEGNQSEDTFISRLLNIMDFSNDEDAMEKAKRIYDVYVN